MKVFISSILILAIMMTFIGIHAFVMKNLADNIRPLCLEAQTLAIDGNWALVKENLDKIHSIWHKKRLWTSLTINTNEIEQIEISLEQSRRYATLHETSDFLGEFIMFSMLIEHIPHQEGFHIEEIL